MPAAVIGLVPAYADYRYVVIDGAPCIVDPDTYEIVDVIGDAPGPVYAGGGSKAQAVGLALTAEEKSIVLAGISPDFPPAKAAVALGLGAEVPPGVDLHTFPAAVLDQVPKLRDYRFVVVETRIVIVDPKQREVALVINR